MSTLFFELIRVSLNIQTSISHIPTEQEWKILYETSEKQALTGVCFAGLQKIGANAGIHQIGMSKALFYDWMGQTIMIQNQNELMKKRCHELQDTLSTDGFRSCILKGVSVSRLYFENLQSLRQQGDIDVWIDASRDDVIKYGMKLAQTNVFDQKHMHYSCFEDTDVEAHWIPVMLNNPLRDRILEQYIERARERQFSNDISGLCVPTNDFQLVHQLTHVYRHYVYEGVGMRQLMDLYFSQRACAQTSDSMIQFDKVLTLFRRLGLMKFVAATQWVLNDVFMMPEQQLLCEPNIKEGQKLLNEIMTGGNFGKYNASNIVDNESFAHRFFRRWGRMFRMIRFDPLGTLLMPFMRLKLELWMMEVRWKYGVGKR